MKKVIRILLIVMIVPVIGYSQKRTNAEDPSIPYDIDARKLDIGTLTLNSAGTGEILLTIPDTSGITGDTIDIPIRASNITNLSGIEMQLKYQATVLTALDIMTTPFTNDFGLVDSLSPGKVTLAMARATGLTSASGILAIVRFSINSAAVTGDTSSIVFQKVRLYDENTNLLQVNTQNGFFIIGSRLTLKTLRINPGDVRLLLNDTIQFTAAGSDYAGNPIGVQPDWNVLGGTGTLNPIKGATTTFTATQIGVGEVIASQEGVADTVQVIVGKRGDITGDGKIDVRDAIVCLRIVAKLILPPIPPGHMTPTTYESWACDLDDDGQVQANDALLILIESVTRLLPKRIIVEGTGPVFVRTKEKFETDTSNRWVSIIVSGRQDVCAASLKVSFDAEKIEIESTNVGKEGVLWISNNMEESHDDFLLAMIAVDGLLGDGGELCEFKVKTNGIAVNVKALSIQSIKLYDAKAQTIEVETEEMADVFIPHCHSLYQNHPNPFNAGTTIRYQIAEAGHVSLAIYNIYGQLVRVLTDCVTAAGEYEMKWNGCDELDRPMPSGIYVYRFNGGRFSESKKMLMIR